MPKELKRRNISGIYIFDKFPTDNRRKPTCVEDCQMATRKRWMEAHDKDYLQNAIKILADSFKQLTEYCYDGGAINKEWRDEFIDMADKWIERSKWNWARHELANQINIICDKITLLADSARVVREPVPDDKTITIIENEEEVATVPSSQQAERLSWIKS